jgi:signal transduction histidine kinase
MTRSLRELTEATVEIARGRLGRQVQVRSQDELGELATSFNKMSSDLAQATQARRQMTADIAHDLRSPLSVIAGYAEALSEGKLPGTPEIYTILHQETKHLNRLVDDLRTLTLADAGELPLTLQSIQPQKMLDQVAYRHAVVARQKGISLRVEPGRDLPDVVVDIERMAQVFDNLITNAFRIRQKGEIVLLQRLRMGAEMQVQDNARVAIEDLPHIFDRFYRRDRPASRAASQASGWRLPSIVEAHGKRSPQRAFPSVRAKFTIALKSSGVETAVSN